jgi:hypothetical protein
MHAVDLPDSEWLAELGFARMLSGSISMQIGVSYTVCTAQLACIPCSVDVRPFLESSCDPSYEATCAGPQPLNSRLFTIDRLNLSCYVAERFIVVDSDFQVLAIRSGVLVLLRGIL